MEFEMNQISSLELPGEKTQNNTSIFQIQSGHCSLWPHFTHAEVRLLDIKD